MKINWKQKKSAIPIIIYNISQLSSVYGNTFTAVNVMDQL